MHFSISHTVEQYIFLSSLIYLSPLFQFVPSAYNSPIMFLALQLNNLMNLAYCLLPFESDTHFGPVGHDQKMLNQTV